MRRVAPARVVLAAAALALLPKVGHADSPGNVVVATSPVVVTTNQTGIGVNICGSNCVQVVYVVNISIVTVNVGSGVVPKMSVDPVMMDFGSVRVGRPSPLRSVSVTNADKHPVTVADAALAGPQSADFAVQTATCITTGAAVVLPPGATCKMDLLFTPTAVGFRVAALHFAVDQLIHWVPLLGVGVQPQMGLSPTTVDFGKVAVGRASQPQDVGLRNIGSAPLTFTGISADGGFAQSSDCLPSPSRASLPPGGTCAVHVTFTPTTRAASKGSLTLASDAPGSPHSVSLSATGIQPAAQIAPSSLKFAGQPLNTPAPAKALVLTNIGADPLELTGTQLTGANSGSFSRTSDCPPSLAPAASCGIKVGFKPQQAGEQSATLTIQDNAKDSPQSVPLAGIGQQVPAAAAPAAASPGPATGGAGSATAAAAATRVPAAPAATPAAPVAAAAPPPPVALAPPPPPPPAPAPAPIALAMAPPVLTPVHTAAPAAAPATCPAPSAELPSAPVLGSQPAGSGLVAASAEDPTAPRLMRDENVGILKSLPRAAHQAVRPTSPVWPHAFDWLLMCLLAGVGTVWLTLFRARRPQRDSGLLILDDDMASADGPAASQRTCQQPSVGISAI